MASLTLKNIPEPLLNRLRRLAVQNRRSLNQQAIHTLEEAIEPARKEKLLTPREAARQMEIWKGLAGQWPSKKSVDEEIANIYKARTRGSDLKL